MSLSSGLRIGYLRAGHDREEARTQLAAACQVVRSDPSPDQPGGGLPAVLGFLGPGDRLVVTGLQSLGDANAALSALEALKGHGAILQVVDPPFTTHGEAGRALAAGLAHTAPAAHPSDRGDEVLSLHAAGIGPSEIARRLQISRMTVWRPLRRLRSA